MLFPHDFGFALALNAGAGDNDFLDRSARNAGYAVFGKVTKGMDVIDQIAKVPTRNYGMHQNVPVNPVKITSVTIKAPVEKN